MFAPSALTINDNNEFTAFDFSMSAEKSRERCAERGVGSYARVTVLSVGKRASVSDDKHDKHKMI